jgi:branched-chain amino acid transport system ATP-binding protein
VCLVRRNGAGKTTTIDGIMGLLPVKSGRVALAGRDITRLPTHQRALAGIGYSPEDAGIFPDLTVAENFLISQSLARAAGRGAPTVGAGNGIDERVLGLFPEIAHHRRGLFLSAPNSDGDRRAMTRRPPSCWTSLEGRLVVVSRFIDA